MRDRRLITDIARERVSILLAMAKSRLVDGDQGLSKRYVRIALELCRHYRIRDRSLDRQVCRGCSSLLVPGLSCRVIVASSRHAVIYKCSACGRENQVPYQRS